MEDIIQITKENQELITKLNDKNAQLGLEIISLKRIRKQNDKEICSLTRKINIQDAEIKVLKERIKELEFNRTLDSRLF